MDKRKAIEIAAEYLSFLVHEKKIAINKAYLFGSYAKNKFNDDSDIDLAIIMPDVKDVIDFQIQLMILRRKFSIDIEPHPINESDFNISNPLAFEILKTGIKIKYK
ncbi:MAG: nucleotidyltransferase domain-containing protein [Bacteroidales bacterium]|jgi:predicted nucleotidyltransferase